jgi:hypothetical protein
MHSTRDAAAAGFMLVTTAVLCAAAGAGIGALVGAPLALWLDRAAAVPAAAVVIAAVAAEVVLLTRWLGHLYDGVDPVEAELLR